MNTKFKHLLAAAALGVAAISASAAPLPQLYFSQAVGWADPTTDAFPDTPASFAGTGFYGGGGLTWQGVSPGTPPGAPAGTHQEMRWQGTGGPNPYSSIDANGFTTANSYSNAGNGTFGIGPDANGEWNQNEYWIITQVHQRNNALGANGPTNNPLWVADVIANFRIFSDGGLTTEIHSDLNSATRVGFQETNNAQPCNSPNGNPLGTTCDDVYTMLPTEFDDIVFSYLGQTYAISFTLFPAPGTLVCFGPGTHPLCAGTPDDGLVRVYTPEIAPGDSYVFVAAAWRAIPEPGSLALAGLGLIGLAAARRRKSA